MNKNKNKAKKQKKILAVASAGGHWVQLLRLRPAFEKLNAEDPEVEVVLISMDFSTLIESVLIPFIKERKIEPEVIVLDDSNANDWIPQVDKNWSGAIPATVIYTKDKREFYERSFTFEELKKEVQKFKN